MSISPMLATAATAVPPGPEWVHEIKWDGMRVLADISGGRLTLTSRNGNDVSAAYELAPIADLYADALLDAEIVAFDDGRPSFPARGADARPQPEGAHPQSDPAGDPHGVRPAPTVRLRPTGQSWRARRSCSSGSTSTPPAGRPHRPMTTGGTARRHRTRASRGSSASGGRHLLPRPPLTGLGQGPAPHARQRRRRRLAPETGSDSRLGRSSSAPRADGRLDFLGWSAPASPQGRGPQRAGPCPLGPRPPLRRGPPRGLPGRPLGPSRGRRRRPLTPCSVTADSSAELHRIRTDLTADDVRETSDG